MTALLELRDLQCGYSGLSVFPGLDLPVHAGEVVALLGPNGAGKTTTLLTVSGILPVIGGSLNVLGKRVTSMRHPEQLAKRGLSHVPEGRALFTAMTVADNMRLAVRNRR